MTLTILLATLSPFLENVTAPVEVAVPPSYAARDMCRLDSGEIRHYGRKLVDGRVRRVYIASTDGYNWTTHLAAEGDPGAMIRIPWSGTWFVIKLEDLPGRGGASLRCYRSKTGPGDVKAEMTVLREPGSYELRQTAFLPERRRIVCSFSDTQTYNRRGNSCYHASVMYSDDDAKTWTMVDVPAIPDVPRLAPGDRMPHWFNDGCEPSLVAMKDGSLRMMVRTSGPYAGFLESRDGGETWRVLPHDRRFWQANTMPLLTRLSDGRLLAVWNNTAMLPTRDPKEYPELGADALSGEWETVFTNRDALHAAISDDEGVTWKGFRELVLCGPRNRADFRQLGNAADQEHDKSVHQTQLIELERGKVLLALGQNVAARRMIVFDPDWLLETGRHDDFRNGFAGLSNHLYVRSLAGGARGWAGHCAFNRVPGALLVRDPETTQATRRELLQLCRVRDPRLVSDRQGVVWNFPAAEAGFVELDVRIAASGFRLTLADHWMNPCDETGPKLSPFTCAVTKELIGGRWCRLRAAFDGASRTVRLSVDGRLVKELAYTGENPAPISYLHLQTLAEGDDPEGTYFRSFDMKAVQEDFHLSFRMRTQGRTTARQRLLKADAGRFGSVEIGLGQDADSTGKPYFRTGDGTCLVGLDRVDDGAWHEIALLRHDGRLALMVDEFVDAETDVSPDVTPPVWTPGGDGEIQNLQVGGRARGNPAVVPVSQLEKTSYHWTNRHERIVREARTLKPDVVLIGDSITHAWAGPWKDRDSIGGDDASPWWKRDFAGIRALNLGFGFDRTQNLLWRIDHGELDGLDPKVVVLLAGINNLGTDGRRLHARGNTSWETAAGIIAVRERIAAKLPKAHVLLMGVFPRGREKASVYRSQPKAVNAILRARYTDDPATTFVDAWEALLDKDGALTEEMSYDGTHLTPEGGFRRWRAVLEPHLKKCLRKNGEP